MITSIIFFVIGVFIGSFTLLASALCVTFGIPETRRRNRDNLLIKPNPLIRNYIVSALLLFAAWFGVYMMIKTFGNSNMMNGFMWGNLIVFLVSLNKLGRTPDNMRDYFQRNAQYIKDVI